ncbi:cell division protein FtsX [Salinibacter altiplanensis]|uniref:cell division protein FtsX n=1 Tax=Salinibacter altiplanensis TaxID=1803181 RepID=UPI000C9EF77B|nr:permease-like cell division protein FtsX [Salinibacter altiplanensis]
MLPYVIREGVANLQRATFSAVASTSAIAVALVLVGVFGIVGYEATVVSDMLREQASQMELFIEQDATEDIEEALHARVRTLPGVARAEFISHEEAARVFREEFGEGASAFEDPTFLPASIKIEMSPSHAHPDSMARAADMMKEWRGAEEVVLNRDLLTRVAQNRQLINAVGLSLGGIVVLAALFLVANTIRLTIYARRLLIRTMKLVGATDRFVRRPFLVEGIVQGFAGGTIAGGVVWGLYRLFFQQIDRAPLSLYTELLLFGGLVGGGVLLGWLGSYFAARRFIQNIELH